LTGVKQAFGSREHRKRVGKINGKRERVKRNGRNGVRIEKKCEKRGRRMRKGGLPRSRVKMLL
jgi:hypothetical protein